MLVWLLVVIERRVLRVGLGCLVFAGMAASCSGAQNPPAATSENTAPTSDELASPASTSSDNTTSSNPDAAGTDPTWKTGTSDYLFDQQHLHTFALEVDETDLAFLDADPAAEQYVEAALSFDGETLPAVGLRYKGSIGAFVGCTAGANPFAPSGPKNCTKLSMKVKINWDGSENTFYGQKKLQFHAMNLDPTLMHDRLGYHLFREMGVPAPRATHARVEVNGEYVGLFAFVEQVDGRFTRANFDDGKGNLYKDVWPIDIDGELTSEDDLLEGLKTNENDNPSFALTREFATAVAEASPEQRPEVVAEWMDMDTVINYIAVDRTLPHDDGPFHLYCEGPKCASHNFYFYEETEAKKMHLIPWDLDNSFGGSGTAVTDFVAIADEWPATQNNCEPFSFGSFGLDQVSAPCHPLFGAWAAYEDEYRAARTAFIEGPFAQAEVDALLETWSAQIADAVREASEIHDDAPKIDAWESALEKLRDHLALVRVS